MLPNGNLDRLQQLTDALPRFTEWNDGYKTYCSNGYKAFSWILHRVGNDILVQRWFIEKGSHWGDHKHVGIETIFIYDGKVEMTIGEFKREYIKGNSFYIPAGQVHSGIFSEDTKAIVITAPVEKEYL